MSDKIKSHHLGRKAILYVRQSSAHQVMHNQESRILQYAMRDRLCERRRHVVMVCHRRYSRRHFSRMPPSRPRVLRNTAT